MEGGMGMRGNLLDPGAQEFYPVSQYAIAAPQIYYPYLPPPPPPPPPPPAPLVYHQQHQEEAQYVSAAGRVAGDGAPTRAVVLSMVPRHVGEEAVRAEMEAFGGVRAVDMGALRSEGVVTVHFYDLRSAQAAVAEVREQHLRQQSRLGQQYGLVPGGWAPWEWTPEAVQQQQMGGVRGLIAGMAVWAQFGAKGLDVRNHGSLVVFNSDGVSSADLRDVFQDFGAVKEVRESQSKHHHKFVEFYDVRDAARALSEINGKEILGRRLVVEFSRPGGQPKSSGGGYQKRSSSYEGFAVPPRLLRNTRMSSRWSQAGEGPSHSSTSQSGSTVGGGGENREGGEGLSLLKRSSTSVTRSSSGNSSSSSGGGGRRNKSGGGGSSSSCYASPSSSTSLKQQSGRKGWKHHSKNSGEARFLFKEVEMEESSHNSFRDSRTTVMIRHIPNKYSQKLLLNMLDNHCIHCNEKIGEGGVEPLSAYDFVYLPIDFSNKCNVGYGFVNLTSPEATWRLYKAFHMQPWEVFNSRKICQVTYARLQGLEALKEHFRNSKFACDNDEYMPVVFSPPRDGKQLTDPVPIGGRGSTVGPGRRIADLARVRHDQELTIVEAPPPTDGGGASSTTTSTHAPSDHADGADEDDIGGEEEGDEGTSSRLSEALLHLSYNQD